MDVAALPQDHRKLDGQGMEEESTFVQTNLVSDGFVPAATIDPNLINPWGVAHSPGGPLWVADNNSGVATIYTGTGTKLSIAGHSAITVAPPPGQMSTSPTGEVFNATGSGFDISSGGKTASS